MKYFLLYFVLTAAALLQAQPKANVNETPYPYDNPVITHMYTADAAPHVMPDGRVWMVTSVDHEQGGGYATMHEYHSFSSADMVNWVDHGPVLHINDMIGGQEPENEDWALWAPDMIYRNGTYYLYFPLRILHTDTLKPDGGRVVTSYIAVAQSDAPDEKFTVISRRIKGTRGIDPCVFIDDDDTPYLYFGSHWGAPLKDNMVELASEPVQLDVDTDRFMEAIWMHKRGGQYYVSYHTKYNWKLDLNKDTIDDPERKKSELAYSVGDSPLGPFDYKGTFNLEPGAGVENGPRHPDADVVPWRFTLSNHGGIVGYHGQDYLFYHTSALSSWRQDEFKAEGTWTQRSVCIDSLNYTKDGDLKLVQQTLKSVDPVSVEQPFAIPLDFRDAETGRAGLSDGVLMVDAGRTVLRFDNIDLGSGYYYFDMHVLDSAAAARAMIRLDAPDGKLAGTIRLSAGSESCNGGRAQTFLRGADGVRDVYVVLQSEGLLRVQNLRFFAGAPQAVQQDKNQ